MTLLEKSPDSRTNHELQNHVSYEIDQGTEQSRQKRIRPSLVRAYNHIFDYLSIDIYIGTRQESRKPLRWMFVFCVRMCFRMLKYEARNAWLGSLSEIREKTLRRLSGGNQRETLPKSGSTPRLRNRTSQGSISVVRFRRVVVVFFPL